MLDLVFYRSSAGNEPVREWLLALPKEARQVIGGDLLTVQGTWPIGLPLVDGFGKGLWEVRSTHVKVEYRVLFGIVGSRIVVLHGFVKKTKKTSHADVEIGRTRLAEVTKEDKKSAKSKS